MQIIQFLCASDWYCLEESVVNIYIQILIKHWEH